MNINYVEILTPGCDVTPENGCFDSMVQFSFGIADCGKMRGAGTGQYNSFRPIFTVLFLSSGCTSKSGEIKMMQ